MSTISKKSADLGEEGFALISVLIACVSIAIIAITVLNYARNVATTNAVYDAGLDARFSTEAGLVRIVAAYSSNGDAFRRMLVPDGRLVPWQYHDRTLLLSVQAESGKLDLNAGDRRHIENLLNRVLADANLRAHVLRRIDEARASSHRIESIGELLPPFERMTQVRDALEMYFTVLTNQLGVDPNTAASITMETMPGLPSALAREIVEARSADRNINLANLPAEVQNRFVPQRPVYLFRAQTGAGFRKAGALQAVVKFREVT